MTEVAATPEPGPPLETLVATELAAVAGAAAVMAALTAELEANRHCPGLLSDDALLAAVHRVEDIQMTMLKNGDGIKDAATLKLIHERHGLPPAAAPVPVPRSHRRKPHPGKHLRLAPVAAIVAVAAAFAARTLTARRVAALTLTALAGGVTAGSVILTEPVRTAPYSAPPVRPPVIRYIAAPATSAPARRKPHRKAPRPAAVASWLVPPPVPSPVPSSSPPASPSSPAPVVSLTLNTTTLNLGVYLASLPGALTISSGGPAVAWTATCTADIGLSETSGILSAGQQNVPLTVRIDPLGGLLGGSCTFEPGGETLTVTWAGAGLPSAVTG